MTMCIILRFGPYSQTEWKKSHKEVEKDHREEQKDDAEFVFDPCANQGGFSLANVLSKRALEQIFLVLLETGSENTNWGTAVGDKT